MTARAAIDCGTNSIRLLILDGDQRIVERATVTRLGKGVHSSRQLDNNSITQTLDVLTAYLAEIKQHDAELVRVIATSAARDATNGDVLLKPARDLLGVEVEIISGDEEARLTFSGALGSSELPGTWTVIDIGGGSTELATGTVSAIDTSHSFDIGSVRLTELFLHSDPPTRLEMEALSEHVAQTLGAYGAVPTQLTAVGGTATSLCLIDRQLRSFSFDDVQGQWLSRDSVAQIISDFLRVKSAERSARTGLGPGRADVIVAGAAILHGAMTVFDLDRCRISAMDLLDGMLLAQSI